MVFLTALLGAAPAAIEVSTLSPAPTVRGGSISAYALTPDGTYAVYLAPGTDRFRQELFAIALDRADAVPVRINRPLPAASDVLDFALGPDSRTVVYRSDEETTGQYELFTYDLIDRTRGRLNQPLPRVSGEWDLNASGSHTGGTIITFGLRSGAPAPASMVTQQTIQTRPGDVHWFVMSQGKNWLVYHAPEGESGPIGYFLAKIDGSVPARPLPYEPLNAPYPEGYAFTPDERGLLVTRFAAGVREIGQLSLADLSVTWLDAWETSEESENSIASIRFDASGENLVADVTVSSSGLFHRLRQIYVTGAQPGRWITDTLGLLEGFELAGLEHLIVSTRDQWATPRTYALRAYSLAGAPTITLDEGDLGGSNELSDLTVEGSGGRVIWRVAQRWYSVQADGQGRVDLSARVAAAGLTPAPGGEVLLDETGRAHWFFHAGGASWRMEADGAGAPVLIAPFAYKQIEEVNQTRNRVLLRGPELVSGRGVYPLYSASLNGAGGLYLSFPVRAEWWAKRSLLVTPDGERGLIVTEQRTLALADFAQDELPPRVLSGLAPLTAAATLAATANPDWALVRGAWAGSDDALYLLPLQGGPARLLAARSDIGNSFASWFVQWAPGGRFLVVSPDSMSNWISVDTAKAAAQVALPDRLFGRLVGLSPDGQALYASGTSTLGFSRVNLETGVVSALEVNPVPSAPANGSLSPWMGVVSSDSSWLALKIDSSNRPEAIWVLPLAGGEGRVLGDRAALGPGIRVLGVTADTVYVSTYEDAVYGLPVDGSAPVRLTESRPGSGGGTGATDVILDLERRVLVYASTYSPGVRRLHRRSLDQPAAAGHAAEVFPLEGWLPHLRAGVIATLHENELWVVGAEFGATPRRITDRAAGEYADDFFLSRDGGHLFYSVFGAAGSAVYRTSPAYATRVRLTPPLTGGRSISSIAPGADSEEILFGANFENRSFYRIYRARLVPDAAPIDGLDHPAYAAWVVANGLPTGNEGAEEDADGDGWPNLFEYIHGTAPTLADATPPYRIEITNTASGWTEFSYVTTEDLRSARLVPQISDDLAEWFDLPAVSAEITARALGPGSEWRGVFETPRAPSFFLRLRFALPDPHHAP